MPFDAMSVFGDSSDDTAATPTAPPVPTKRVNRSREFVLLGLTVVCVGIAAATAAANAGATWLAGYGVAVFGGVSALGFYRQATVATEARTHILTSRGKQRLQVILGVLLVVAAIINAVRLSILWS